MTAGTGRERTFVVVVDDTPECKLALRFAAGRAAHMDGGRLKLLHVLPPAEFATWGTVQAAMEQEARERAEHLLVALAEEVRDRFGIEPQLAIETGSATDRLLNLLQSDASSFALVLAASARGDPGPLVDFFTGPIVGALPCPVVIVPGTLSEDAVDRLA